MRYHASTGVALERGACPFFSTPTGGVIVTDDALAALWSEAQGRTLEEIVSRSAADHHLRDVVRESLACLVRAGLLAGRVDANPTPPAALPLTTSGPQVSVIIVVSDVRELEFLDPCVQSVAASNYRPLDLIVVDNASGSALEPRVRRHMPDARVLPLRRQQCLAAASNAALAMSDAPYALLMNPDVKLQRDCVARLVSRALANANAAAVVPKTLLWRTPAFLNAIGNRVPARGWGTDNGIGQLDLGQFDGWREAPSASLTIELVTRSAWLRVGPFDDSYPAYYEDADWAYRARLAGWIIAAEPSAQAWHIFGGFWDAPPEGGLSARKLTTAVVGRLRFAGKIASPSTLAALLRNYLWEDGGNVWASCRRRDWRMVRAYLAAWAQVVLTAPRLVGARRRVQAARARDDRALFPPESGMPLSCMHRNAPVLTAPLIRDYYAPLIREGMTNVAPEAGGRRADAITAD